MPTPIDAPGVSGAVNTGLIRAPQPGGDSSRLWVPAAQTARALVSTQGGLRAMATQRGRNPVQILDVFHPFKIYQVPDVISGSPDPATDWLKVRVRAGLVVNDDFDGVAVSGTDAAALPDTEDYPAVSDIAVPAATPKFYFWVDISNTAAPFLDHANVAPDLDGTIVPIGWADSNTNAATRTLNIRQLQRTDIEISSGRCPL